MKILDAIQECSGLRVLVVGDRPGDGSDGETSPVRLHGTVVPSGSPVARWLNPPEDGLSLEEAERLIEEQQIKVVGRL